MLNAYRGDDVRAAEEVAMAAAREGGGTGGELMQRAAAGVATAALGLLRRAYGSTVLVLAGPGNNGGDALHAAARLARRGAAVRYCGTSGRGLHTEGEAACRAAGGRPVDLAGAGALLRAGRVRLVVDGVLGLGGRGDLPADVATLAALCRDTSTPVLAVDVPSGTVADGGAVGDTFSADLTVTFGARRLAHLMEPAASRCGEVRVVPIGIELGRPTLLGWEVADLVAALPVPGPLDHKYSRGVVGLDTGSTRYPGAALLGVSGAVHTGVGMVRYLGPAGDVVTTALPNVVTADGRVQALVLGSGWGDSEDTGRRLREAVDRVVGEGSALLLDADALTSLGTGRGPRGLTELGPDRLLLTPHAGELARLLDVPRSQVEQEPLAHARQAAERLGATVLLKGATQYVVGPGEGPVEVAVPGPAWTGQAGSGDVLAGICGALLAAGLPAARAGAAGASLQAVAAARRPGPHPPQELAARLPEVVSELVGVGSWRAGRRGP
ncbi:bifunctional ADP-dependent NAD(P)H-hydrate dehydratase/NAD(P)H-hydrate epimerase [Auraticoccus monumenti]|uniref:Bifunctional NAD(P)H-hydrate repair enzyme n=1 Tax=Auraticoccus monumenti TaxID=675864 RepID=A0A1G6XHC6_9ACTN|nr:bifunctional ADP-dependent NAD(P)H-hydrate dehydratase/NAD(P)H-hydrate epimerase [Auraticoccus monumenti]SDD77203.1 yjeF C-terminal region, hydroxyethylthiazole kinase-related/yjeF N-terminal region [Auraticoccus monumenti]